MPTPNPTALSFCFYILFSYFPFFIWPLPSHAHATVEHQLCCSYLFSFMSANNVYYAVSLAPSISNGRPPPRTLNPTLAISQSLCFGCVPIPRPTSTTTFPLHKCYIVWHKPRPTLAVSSSSSTLRPTPNSDNCPCARFLIPLTATSIPPSCPIADKARKARQTSSTLRKIHAHETQLFRVAISSRTVAPTLHCCSTSLVLALTRRSVVRTDCPIRTDSSR